MNYFHIKLYIFKRTNFRLRPCKRQRDRVFTQEQLESRLWGAHVRRSLVDISHFANTVIREKNRIKVWFAQNDWLKSLPFAELSMNEKEHHRENKTNDANDNIGNSEERILATQPRRIWYDNALGPFKRRNGIIWARDEKVSINNRC